ncbi:MAG TPA: hypothetical protein PKE15_00260 [Ottowia sp.]|nr:hypothetical protein [Ottowia sp.]
MATAENAKLQYEGGQNVVAMTALTDSGDHTKFSSAAALWSQRSGYAPVIRPNGVLTGGAVSVNATNNQVTVAALTLNLNGVVSAVASAAATVTRPAGAVAKVNSITINNAGAITVLAGTDGATAAFTETRGAAGGRSRGAPPAGGRGAGGPATTVEIAQVRLTTTAAAAVAASEIYQVVGLHLERADFPLYEVKSAQGAVSFLQALDAIHTGNVAKAVFASYASPIFADVALASDFTPPETTHSVNSTPIYGTTLGSSSSTLGQGAFTAYLKDGVTDALVALKNQILWFKFFPDRYASPYILTQGKLGISRTFPAGDAIQAACTISASEAAAEAAS